MSALSENLKLTLIFLLIIVFLISILPIIAFLNPNNRCIKGDPASFDPIEQYEVVKRYAGGDDLNLVSIKIHYVKRNGTINLYADYKPHVIYEFYKRMPPKKSSDMPLGTEVSHPKYKLITVKIRQPYRFEFWKYKPGSAKGRFHLGMLKESYDLSAEPKQAVKPNCSIKGLWDKVLKLDKHIPEDAVAVITFTDRGFSFSIKNTKYSYTFDSDGNQIT